ncbi:hypothetical protein BGZ88_008883, partial [Linnemannia elongata]
MGILERELDYYRPMVAMIRVSAILKSRCCFSNLIPVQTEVTISLQTLFFDQFCLAQAEIFELQA